MATVDNDGNIKSISEGKAEITAISADGEIKSTCYVEVKESLPPIINSFTSDKTSPQVSGNKVSLKVEASGVGELQYKFLIRDSKGNWYVIRNYSSLNTCTWTTGTIGDNILYVDVKDENGNITRKEMSYKVISEPPIIDSFIPNKLSPQASGTVVTLTAQASGIGKLQYKFLVRDNKGNWYVIRNYSSLNTCTWTTGAIGNKTLYVDVKDSNGSVTRKSIVYKVASIAKPTISSFKTNLASPQTSGTKVTLKATATGTGALQYKFVIRDEKGNYYVLRDFASSNTFEWQTGNAGTKTLIVHVKDSYGSTVSKEMAYTIKAKSSVNINSLYTSKTSPQKVGTALAINTDATGTGTVNYKYSIYTANKGWEVLSDYSTSSLVVWNPTKADSYKIKVEVKDSTGTIESKVIDFTINN